MTNGVTIISINIFNHLSFKSRGALEDASKVFSNKYAFIKSPKDCIY